MQFIFYIVRKFTEKGQLAITIKMLCYAPLEFRNGVFSSDA